MDIRTITTYCGRSYLSEDRRVWEGPSRAIKQSSFPIDRVDS